MNGLWKHDNRRIIHHCQQRLQAMNKIITGDCLEVLKTLPDNSAHMILTDPPYFIDGLDNNWQKGKPDPKPNGSVKGLPVGMKFDPQQGANLQKFLQPVFQQCLRILKPGGFLLSFASPRLLHRTGMAAENAGFEIRDMYTWNFTKKAQFKAFSLQHFAKKIGKAASQALGNRKTPQLRPQFEPILCAQKPKDGTALNNWLQHRTGLIDPEQRHLGSVPSTTMLFEKDPKNGHLTPKPLALCEHLIKIFTEPGQYIIDPFSGSGTTCLAAKRTNRQYTGIEINPEYADLGRNRLQQHD